MKSTLWLKDWFVGIFCAAILGACTASASESLKQDDPEMSSTQPTGKVVGISLPNNESSRWLTEGDALEKTFAELGYRVNLMYSNNDTDEQIEQIQEMLSEGVNILVIAPVDGTALGAVLEAAHESGVLVIAYDRMMLQTKDVDFLVTFNHYETGVLQGKQIENALGLAEGKGPYNFELFAGEASDTSAQAFYEGGLSVLKPYIDNGQLVIQSNQIGLEQVSTREWDGVTAQVRMHELIKSFYKRTQIDAILSPSDHISLGILSALKKAGYGAEDKPFPVITGQGAVIDSIKAIIAGEQTFTILLDERVLVKQTAQMVDAVLQGKAVPVNNSNTYFTGEKYIPTFEIFPKGIDIENYKEILVDSGYIAADQINELSEK